MIQLQNPDGAAADTICEWLEVRYLAVMLTSLSFCSQSPDLTFRRYEITLQPSLSDFEPNSSNLQILSVVVSIKCACCAQLLIV